MRIVGIDPGLTGAIAVLEDRFLIELYDMPVLDKRVQGNQLAELLRDNHIDVVVVEDIHAMPRGGIASFSLGWSVGVAVAVVQTLQLPLVRMRATEWQKRMGLIGKDKDASRRLASELFPQSSEMFRRKKDDGRADAALIAEAYRRREQV